MPEKLRELAPLALALIACALVVAVLTVITLHNFKDDCQHKGGTYTVEGGTAWCRY